MNNYEPISVSQLTSQIREIVESNFQFIYVTGEISNFKHQISSGHYYFVLKDSGAQISAAMWKQKNMYLNFKPEDGMKVNLKGKVTIYPPRGNYQIDVFDMEQQGLGEMLAALEKLKEKLTKEGLFDNIHKIPFEEFCKYPENVAIITSETGAVINDFKKIASKRFPITKIFLFPVKVQGAGSDTDIISALKFANQMKPEPDIIVIARGGGSIEDLWTFNREEIVREVFACNIPIVSAIGHETDFTLLDCVADLRASTPSNAAELIFPDINDIEKSLNDRNYDIKNIVNDKFDKIKSDLTNISNNFHFNKPLNILNNYKMKIDEYEKDFMNIKDEKFYKINNNLDYLAKLIINTGQEKILKRGYTYVVKNGKVISRKKLLNTNDVVGLHFYDGSLEAKINKNEQEKTRH